MRYRIFITGSGIAKEAQQFLRENDCVFEVGDPKDSPEDLAREFEPSAQAIRNWAAQADRDDGRRGDGLNSAEREELRRLRKENRELRVEREILGKAAAWFAREGGSIPPKRSNS